MTWGEQESIGIDRMNIVIYYLIYNYINEQDTQVDDAIIPSTQSKEKALQQAVNVLKLQVAGEWPPNL